RRNPVVSTPALFFTGTLDGRTNPESHAEIAAGLPNHSIITVNHAGHNLFFSHPEIVPTIERFLAGEAVESVELDAEFKLSQ
ncbi:MAG: alpha/beta hydrolase, partial [Planctomycetota bacterium]